jgi:hypothetical protein
MPRRKLQSPAAATNDAPAPETSTKLTRTPPQGGTLRTGNPGNRGNAHPLGPPSALLRGELRGSYAERKGLLDEIARGDLIVQTSVSLAEVMRHIRCAQCAGPVVAPEVEDIFLLTFPAMTSASVKDRLSALDQMAKYGVGTLKEVSIDNVRERVQRTLDTIRVHCTPEQADVLYRALEPVWK